MVLLVFAAVAAMLFAPSRHPAATAVAGAPTTVTTPAVVRAEPGSEVLDPWAKPAPASAPVGGLATDAAMLAARDIRDPWASPPQAAPPGPIVLLDLVLDPWSSTPPTPRRLRAPLADQGGNVVDPWAPPTDHHAPPQAALGTPRPGSDLQDPWGERWDQTAPSPRVKAAPSPRRSSPPRTSDVKDPWSSR